jgi:hypothetical protein
MTTRGSDLANLLILLFLSTLLNYLTRHGSKLLSGLRSRAMILSAFWIGYPLIGSWLPVPLEYVLAGALGAALARAR